MKVFLLNGRETWPLIHIEIQDDRDNEFEKRMFVYNYRISDRYDREVVSLAVLTDRSSKWRPGRCLLWLSDEMLRGGDFRPGLPGVIALFF